jgi:putative acetyltransferase
MQTTEPVAEAAIELRLFRPADQPAAMALFRQVLHDLAPPGMEASAEKYIAEAIAEDYGDLGAFYAPGRGSGFWVALSETGQLVGTFGLKPAAADAVELRRMFVVPGMRRRGVARTMLAHAEAMCGGWGIARIVLRSSQLHRAALALYRDTGFAEVESKPVNVDGVIFRTFRLEKRLDGAA